MKITRLLLIVLVCSVSNLFGQAPQAINYQGIARDLSGNPLVSQAIGLQLTIHNTTATGPVDYQETFAVTTNQFGLYTVQIGRGTPVSGTFSTIAWGTASHYLEVAMDPTGGNAYVAAGTSELISVPYALYAETSGNGAGPVGPTGPSGVDGAAGPAGPAGANGATGATGPAGANGATGATGAAGPTGAVGATGAAGPTGATGSQGVITTLPIQGYASAGPFTSTVGYVFVGPTVTVVITSTTQKLVFSGEVPLATTSGIATCNLGACYQLGAGPITNFTGGNYSIVQIDPLRSPQAVAGCVTGLAPGTYTIGIGISQSGTTAINNNDYVNAWVMLVD